jgi:hypothetical protein
LPYDNWVHAASLDITLPEAEQTLTLYQPQKADSNSEDFPERLQVKEQFSAFAADTQVAEEQIFWHGFSGAALNYELLSMESGIKDIAGMMSTSADRDQNLCRERQQDS